MRKYITVLTLLLSLLIVIPLGAQSARRAIFNLFGRTDANGNLMVASAAYAGQPSARRAIGNLFGRTDANGNLMVAMDGTSGVGFGANGSISAPNDGVFTLLNAAGNNFTRLQFGGTTSAFPSLGRSGTAIVFQAADGTGGVSTVSGSNSSFPQVQVSGNYAITPASGTGITLINGGSVARQVYKITVASTAFVCAATTCDVTIAGIPAKTIILGTYADLTQTFACTATCTSSTLSATLGLTPGGTHLLLSFDVDAATAQFGDADSELGSVLARATAIQGGAVVSWASAGSVTLRLTSGTGNIGNGTVSNLSQGSITFYIITERLP